jgi:hypothetical protein
MSEQEIRRAFQGLGIDGISSLTKRTIEQRVCELLGVSELNFTRAELIDIAGDAANDLNVEEKEDEELQPVKKQKKSDEEEKDSKKSEASKTKRSKDAKTPKKTPSKTPTKSTTENAVDWTKLRRDALAVQDSAGWTLEVIDIC